MGRLGPTEILLIIGIALLLFGGGRIAEIGKGLGEGIRNFKKGMSEPSRLAGSQGDDDKSKKRLQSASAPADQDGEAASNDKDA